MIRTEFSLRKIFTGYFILETSIKFITENPISKLFNQIMPFGQHLPKSIH